MTEAQFWQSSLLGKSIARLQRIHEVRTTLACSNDAPLASLYNSRINDSSATSILIFVHDDVWLQHTDFFAQVARGLEFFDVVGVAGTIRLFGCQPSWLFKNMRFERVDDAFLSGQVWHGEPDSPVASDYGIVPAECVLLDGVLLAAQANRLRSAQVYFDPQFDFHFYDLDFCRSAVRAGLRLGTWSLPLVHASTGSYGTSEWLKNYGRFFRKWGSDVGSRTGSEC